MKYIDLFCGCGGLSLGLEQAGFDLALAVEKSEMAAETFYHNFIERITCIDSWKSFSSQENSIKNQAQKKLVVKELSAVLDCKNLLDSLRSQNIDLVAGGPPCQGFSLAGRRNPSDVRNQLPWQFLEFVESVVPKAVIIENVSGMGQDFLKHGVSSPFRDLMLALRETGAGYMVQPLLLNAKHFGAPQNRPRLVIIGIRADIAESAKLHVSDEIWKSDFDFIETSRFQEKPSLAPDTLYEDQDVLSVKDAIFDLNDTGYGRRNFISDFALEMRQIFDWMPLPMRSQKIGEKLPNHKLRKHAPSIQTRFRLYQYFRDQKIHSKILAVPKDSSLTAAGQRSALLNQLKTAKIPARSADNTIIANTLEDLIELVMSLATKKHSQRPLDWSAPSPTVVSLPDDYVHPQKPRTMTVRELARFQSFPDAFEFRAKETTGSLRRRFEVPQYTQVGNAVPPKLAYSLGKLVKSILTLEKS